MRIPQDSGDDVLSWVPYAMLCAKSDGHIRLMCGIAGTRENGEKTGAFSETGTETHMLDLFPGQESICARNRLCATPVTREEGRADAGGDCASFESETAKNSTRGDCPVRALMR